ncbi:MAG: single-stranded-DNA-specific exonuclease RecJ [Bacteroidia bacterium]|nr:MAG: single-stranded-DNA-specific exonuclease RecJ [Bacteroidia bacterium]
MEYIWNILEQGNEEDTNRIVDILNIDRTLAGLLAQRGITNFDDAKTFFRPELIQLHNPFLMKDMDKAVERLEKAILNKEKILIYGDYDVDGTTSVALIYSFLRKFKVNAGYYIPDRYIEGYGISLEGINYAEKNNFSLVIALDCGIKAVKKIEIAKGKNIDFIICDHHTPGEKIPDAYAVLDPKREDCPYPYKELSGCGVGFKLIQAFTMHSNPLDFSTATKREINKVLHQELAKYLDYVTVSIASDIVPITGENRILTYFGLKQLNKNPCTGLQAIMKISGVEEKQITVSDLVFKVGPRINAAGRIQKGFMAVKLLICQDEEEAMRLGEEINNYNAIRKDLDQSITEEALQLIETNAAIKNKRTTVLFNRDWHKGVIGIVASRLTETYYRPTVILTESRGMATGSARSVIGFDLYSAISNCSDLLEAFGGHKYAAGLTMKIENVENFTEKFEKIVTKNIQPEQLYPQIDIDAQIHFRDITPKFYRILKQFAPFGPENMKPIFLSTNVHDSGGSRIVGASNEHLRLELTQGNISINGIGFGLAKYLSLVKSGKAFKICYTIEENDFRGVVSLQLVVKDIKPQD